MRLVMSGAMLAGSALADLSGPSQNQALFTLTLLVGLFMMGAGLLRLGRLMRFVSNAVMVGFLTGVSVLVVLSQLGDFTGYGSQYSNKVLQSIDLLLHPAQVQGQTLAIGLLTILLIVILDRTWLRNFSMLLAMILASLVVILLDWQGVQQVGDVAVIPSGLPMPGLRKLSLIPELIAPALSIMIIGLVQGAGISKAYPNPDGNYPDISRDFTGQGAANAAAGIFQGMPLGGSVASTALNVSAGARSRWANVFAGLVIVVVVLLFSRAVSLVAMPAMAGLLIVIGFRTFKPAQVEMVWKTGSVQQAVMGITFISCLLIPLQYAVLVGVAMSLLMFVIQQSNKITIKQWKETEGPYPIEQDPPKTLPANDVLLLVPYGSLFFAAAPIFEKQLPGVDEETTNTAVVLNLRGYEDLGSTFLEVLERYADDLHEHHSKLILGGVHDSVIRQLEKTGLIKKIGRENIFVVSDQIGQAGAAAWDAANKWVAEQSERPFEGISMQAKTRE